MSTLARFDPSQDGRMFLSLNVGIRAAPDRLLSVAGLLRPASADFVVKISPELC